MAPRERSGRGESSSAFERERDRQGDEDEDDVGRTGRDDMVTSHRRAFAYTSGGRGLDLPPDPHRGETRDRKRDRILGELDGCIREVQYRGIVWQGECVRLGWSVYRHPRHAIDVVKAGNMSQQDLDNLFAARDDYLKAVGDYKRAYENARVELNE